MLNQLKHLVYEERLKEQERYKNISTKGYKFEKGPACYDLVGGHFQICELQLTDRFGYKFVAYHNGNEDERFYTLANAKRYVIQTVSDENYDPNHF